MKPKNFPNQKQQRRLAALARLKDALHRARENSEKYNKLSYAIANTEDKISRHSDYRRTKIDRSARGKLRRE